MPVAVQRQQIAVPEKTLWLAGGVAVLLFAGPQIARWLSEKIGSAAGGIVVQGVTGLVVGVGKSVGIPETDATVCQQHLDAGDFWQASFYCPAGTFLKASWGAIFDASTGEQVGSAAPGATEVIEIRVTDEIFALWIQNTGGALKPGQSQQQAALEWFNAYVAAPF